MNFVIWTACIAVLLYLAGLGMRISQSSPKVSQIVGTVGFMVFLVHVWAAFEFIHNWSHREAWKQTAQQTEDLTGWYWGGGIWFNYLFLLLWGLDVVLLWTRRKPQKLLLLVIHSYLIFIVINATAVFGSRWWVPVLLISGAVIVQQTWKVHLDHSLRIHSHD